MRANSRASKSRPTSGTHGPVWKSRWIWRKGREKAFFIEECSGGKRAGIYIAGRKSLPLKCTGAQTTAKSAEDAKGAETNNFIRIPLRLLRPLRSLRLYERSFILTRRFP